MVFEFIKSGNLDVLLAKGNANVACGYYNPSCLEYREGRLPNKYFNIFKKRISYYLYSQILYRETNFGILFNRDKYFTFLSKEREKHFAMQTSENLMKNLRNQSVVSKETLIHARKGGKYRLRMQNLFNW